MPHEGESVRQFHQENRKMIAEFSLGRGPPMSLTPTFEYYPELYRDGTPCDLTGKVG
jgi:hypothetical protein